jgi:hypothetical protein
MKNPLSGQALSEPFLVMARQSLSGRPVVFGLRVPQSCAAARLPARFKGTPTNVACDFIAPSS